MTVNDVRRMVNRALAPHNASLSPGSQLVPSVELIEPPLGRAGWLVTLRVRASLRMPLAGRSFAVPPNISQDVIDGRIHWVANALCMTDPQDAYPEPQKQPPPRERAAGEGSEI